MHKPTNMQVFYAYLRRRDYTLNDDVWSQSNRWLENSVDDMPAKIPPIL